MNRSLGKWLSALVLGMAAAQGILHGAPETKLGNGEVARHLSWADGRLKTAKLENTLARRELIPTGGDEFAITYRAEGAGQSTRLTADDFQVYDTKRSEAEDGTTGIRIQLKSPTAPIDLTVRYSIRDGQPWMRKDLQVTARQPLVIEKVEVEHLDLEDAYSPYKANQLTATGPGKWRPPLGQPLYTKTSATWWGMEFPAARNEIKDGHLVCGYLTKVSLKAGDSWQSQSAAMGVADDPAFVKEAFFAYIDATRARPLRLQTQYNSWFDYGQGVNTKNFTDSVRKVNEELVVKRGVPPLRSYVIDDGWQDTGADWTKTGVWITNGKFPNDFAESKTTVTGVKSELGLWLSPGCLFGAQGAIPKMREAGWRALDPWMSMTGPDYMDALEKRMVALANDGVGYFKLDGVFGHLNVRNFDIDGFKGGEAELNEAKHDDAKELYLSLGTERLSRIFKQMDEAKPDVYIVISNGAFLSPWWLQHIDAVWMINADDAAAGSGRNGELVYRDAVYHQLASAACDNTQFPLHSIFNHEPKKTESGESEEEFRRYLYMNFSRGTGFAELYLKTFKLSDSDWAVLADAMKWLHRVFPTFKNARMIGGNPAKGEVYGYTGWAGSMGYVSLHNPSKEPREFTVRLDRALGLSKEQLTGKAVYQLSSPFAEDAHDWVKTAPAGGEVKITLPPRAIRILEFQGGN